MKKSKEIRHMLFFFFNCYYCLYDTFFVIVFFFFFDGHGPWTGLFNIFHHGNKMLMGGGEKVSSNKYYKHLRLGISLII